MNKLVSILLISVSFLILVSCSKTESRSNGLYVGSWELVGSETPNVSVYKRVENLPSENYGFTIESDFEYIENNNSGWCGTPPICFTRYNGTWEEIDTDLLNIEVESWQTENLRLSFELVSVDENNLKVIITYL